MTSAATIDGKALLAALAAGTRWLEANAAAVDALNVFPVPDGDTGTNMLLTMRSAVAEAEHCTDASASATAAGFSRGALLGARGNSGVILSQILRGLAEGLRDTHDMDGPALAQALQQATQRAYQSVATPVEGTMLTVIRAAAVGASQTTDASAKVVLERALAAAQQALAETPDLLPVLKQAGVVDAGGQGLVLLLEGTLAELNGHPLAEGYQTLGEIRRDWLAEVASQHHGKQEWGYCTEFLLHEFSAPQEDLQEQLSRMGNSLLVVGDSNTLHVHLHTRDPDAVLSLAASFGSLHNIKVENMQAQQNALLERADRLTTPAIPVVAVVAGDGLAAVFRSMGAMAIISGGQTMNPSTGDILAAVATFPHEAVILLPNNANVIASCQQAQQLTSKRLAVIPTRTVPQGIAALLALNPEVSISNNVEAMTASLETVRTIELTIATRDATIEGVVIRKGQYVSLLDDRLTAAADSVPDVFHLTLDLLQLPRGALVTLYHGRDTSAEEAERLAEALRLRPGTPEVEVLPGGQPHYHYIASVEC